MAGARGQACTPTRNTRLAHDVQAKGREGFHLQPRLDGSSDAGWPLISINALMRWINFLERRFANLAIPGLIRIVVAFNALVYLLLQVHPDFVDTLTLRPRPGARRGGVAAGDLRFHPAVSIPTGCSQRPVWAFFYLSLLWLFGDGLEQAWGSFRLNLYYLHGHGGNDGGGVSARLAGRHGRVPEPVADVCVSPRCSRTFRSCCFSCFPVRVKWIALLSLVLRDDAPVGRPTLERLTIVISLANYLLFFGQEWVRLWREQGRGRARQQVPDGQAQPPRTRRCTIARCAGARRSPRRKWNSASPPTARNIARRTCPRAAPPADLPPPLPQ